MRLIDADALLKELRYTDRYFMVKYDIESAPTVTPTLNTCVDVIREYCQNRRTCEDCLFFRDDNQPGINCALRLTNPDKWEGD